MTYLELLAVYVYHNTTIRPCTNCGYPKSDCYTCDNCTDCSEDGEQVLKETYNTIQE